MPSKTVTHYECGVCYQTHSDSYDARNCCEPETVTMHQCIKCDEVYGDKETADDCCYGDFPICGTEMGDHPQDESIDQYCAACHWQTGDPVPPTPAELEQAGQLRIDL